MARFHRSHFQKALANRLDESIVTAHFKKRLISYTQPSSEDIDKLHPIELQFKDGTTATCDMLIGADGIHSAIRGQMYRDLAGEIKTQDPAGAERLLDVIDVVWSGSLAFRGVFPKEKLEAIAPGHRVMTAPMNVCHFALPTIQDG